MTEEEYIVESERTLSNNFYGSYTSAEELAALFDSVGVLTELADSIKKSLFYAKKRSVQTSLFKEKGLEVAVKDGKFFHAILGLLTEVGELFELFRMGKASNRKDTIDRVNLVEELGDIQRYLSILYREFNIDPKRVREVNISKLKQRFPQAFCEEKALSRDIPLKRLSLQKYYNSAGKV